MQTYDVVVVAAGGAGSVWGDLTRHGGGLTDGLVFGPVVVRPALGGTTSHAGSAPHRPLP